MDFPRIRRLALSGLALAGSGGSTAPLPSPGWVLPPLDGEVAGEVQPLFLPGAPALQWRATIRSERPHERLVALALDGPGLKLRGSACLDSRGEGTWLIDELTIDLGEWFGRVAPRFLPALAQASLSGQLTIRGAGAWRGGQWSGRAEVALPEGRFEDATRGLILEGLTLRLEVEDLAARRTAAAQVLAWRQGTADTVPLGPGHVEFSLDGDVVKVTAVQLALLGGQIQAGPAEFSAQKPDVKFTARLQGVDLRQMLFLLPPVLAAAQGRLDGEIALHSSEVGLQIGVGWLRLRPGEKADLQFAPSPGLLTAQLPAEVRKYYPGLEKLETGGIPLRADRLEIALTPAGDEQGRTAAVRIEGGPVDPALQAPVVLQINVRGPLESVVKFGTHSKLHFGGGGK